MEKIWSSHFEALIQMTKFDFVHSQNVREISIQMSDSFSSNLQGHPRSFKNSLLNSRSKDGGSKRGGEGER